MKEYNFNKQQAEIIYEKSYDKNGQLYNEVNYIDGKINGIYKLYYDNGQLLKEVNYINGKKC